MRINHINIVTTNMDKSVAFYEGTLGLKRVWEGDLEGAWFDTLTALAGAKARCVFLQDADGGVRIELLQYAKPLGGMLPNNSLPNTQGIRHIAFEVPDIDAVFEKLLVAGTPVKSEPVEVPFPVAGATKRLFYAMDPDGVIVEIASYHTPK